MQTGLVTYSPRIQKNFQRLRDATVAAAVSIKYAIYPTILLSI
jgi:hypothetical protein